MNRTTIALTALLLLAPTVAAADVEFDASSSCDPSAGPFDPCLWECAPFWENTCWAIITAGGAVWRCATGGPC